MAEKHLDCAIRSSLENFGKYNKVDMILLYERSNLYLPRKSKTLEDKLFIIIMDTCL